MVLIQLLQFVSAPGILKKYVLPMFRRCAEHIILPVWFKVKVTIKDQRLYFLSALWFRSRSQLKINGCVFCLLYGSRSRSQLKIKGCIFCLLYGSRSRSQLKINGCILSALWFKVKVTIKDQWLYFLSALYL